MPIERNYSLLNQLKRHEGFSAKAYRCPAGALTIGYGHNLDALPIDGITEKSRISQERAIKILRSDVTRCAEELDKSLVWWRSLDTARQGVMLNMVFNLGINKFLGFVKTILAIRRGNYAEARNEMLASRWASQVGKRAWELARQMETGEWQDGTVPKVSGDD